MCVAPSSVCLTSCPVPLPGHSSKEVATQVPCDLPQAAGVLPRRVTLVCRGLSLHGLKACPVKPFSKKKKKKKKSSSLCLSGDNVAVVAGEGALRPGADLPEAYRL
jgi:hypothetical protein